MALIMFPRQAVGQVCLLDDCCVMPCCVMSFSNLCDIMFVVYLQQALPADMILRAVLPLLKRERSTTWSRRKKSMVINILVEAMHGSRIYMPT